MNDSEHTLGPMNMGGILQQVLACHSNGRDPECRFCPLGDIGPRGCQSASKIATELQRQGWN